MLDAEKLQRIEHARLALEETFLQELGLLVDVTCDIHGGAGGAQDTTHLLQVAVNELGWTRKLLAPNLTNGTAVTVAYTEALGSHTGDTTVYHHTETPHAQQ